MLVIIPASITEIDATQKGNALIHDNDFFVMGPKKYADFGVIRMPQHFNIFRAFFYKTLLTVETVYAKSQFHLFVYHHKDLHSCKLEKMESDKAW